MRERVSAPATAQENGVRMHAILNAAVDAIVTTDARGIVQLFNPAAERMFGYASAEVVGQPVTMLMAEPERSRHDGYMRRYIETGEARVIGTGRATQAAPRRQRVPHRAVARRHARGRGLGVRRLHPRHHRAHAR